MPTLHHITEDLNHQHHCENVTACIPLQCWQVSVSLNTCTPGDDTHSIFKTYFNTLMTNVLVNIIVTVPGVAMVPVSWTEMQCPKTYVKEPRKVAKVVPETAAVD